MRLLACGLLGLSVGSCITPRAEEAIIPKAEARLRPAIPRPEEEIIQDAMAKVYPAVVFIKPIQKEFRGGKMEKIQTFGSGVIIDTEGHVVTNNHVAEKATEIRCVLSDRQEVAARVVGLDPETDLAVIKLDLSGRASNDPLPYAEFGDSDRLRAGEVVIAMGAPHGLSRSVSRGIVSSLERYFAFAPYNLWIQTDAAINPGNSGGPLVDIHGRVIGINARRLSGAENLGFAIPARIVTEVVREIIAHGRVSRAWTGLRFQALKDFTKSSFIDARQGVLVASVDEGSPAERAHLRAGDIVVSLAGEPVQAMYEIDLPRVERRFAALPPGRSVRLDALRAGKRLSLDVVPTTKGKQEGADFECKKWEMTLKEITPFSDPFLYFQKPGGIYVQGVKYGGNAQAAGFAPMDVILSIGDRKIESLADAREAYVASLDLQPGDRKRLFRMLRNGYRRLAVLDFEKDSDRNEEQE